MALGKKVVIESTLSALGLVTAAAIVFGPSMFGTSAQGVGQPVMMTSGQAWPELDEPLAEPQTASEDADLAQ